MDDEEYQVHLNSDIQPDVAGWAIHDWRRDVQDDQDVIEESWTSLGWSNGASLATERHESYWEIPETGHIEHIVVPEVSWLMYEVPEITDAIEVTYQLRGFMRASYAALPGLPSTLDMNPDLAMVVTQIPVDDYNVNGANFEENPGEPLTRITGPDAVTEPELGRMPFANLTFEGTGTAFTEENTPFAIDLTGVPDDLIEHGGLLALRLWLHPEEPVHSVLVSDGTTFISEASMAVWFPSVDPETFPDPLQPQLHITVRTEEEVEQEVIHVRHVAKRRREQFRRPSHTLRLRG